MKLWLRMSRSEKRLPRTLQASMCNVYVWRNKLEQFLKHLVLRNVSSIALNLRHPLLRITTEGLLSFHLLTIIIIQSLEDRFFPCSLIASSLLGIVPSVCCTREVCIDKAIDQYISDLPSPELFPAEMRRWKQRNIKMPCNICPSSPAEAVKDCDADLFSNIHILLRIICTIPVTSCECERSASCLRRLNNYMRASMGKSRLSSQAGSTPYPLGP